MTTIEGPRSCRPGELPQVIALVDGAMRQGSDQTLFTDYPLVYAPDNLVNVQVVTVDGRVVATAPVLPRVVQGPGFRYGIGIISPTATDPAFQHRGFGSACVRACIERMDDAGIEASVLWTMVATFPFYELNGYQAIRPDLEKTDLGVEDADRFRESGDVVRELDVRDAAAVGQIRAIHEADSPGIVRTSEDWPRLLALPKMRTLVARRGARIVAYLVDSRASNKPGVVEAGGAPLAVETLIGHALRDRAPDERVTIAFSRGASVLRSVVVDRLGEGAALQAGGDTMVRINDPKSFWRAIGQHGAPPPLERRELASVIFGPHPARWVTRPASMAGSFPIPLPIPPLDHS